MNCLMNYVTAEVFSFIMQLLNACKEQIYVFEYKWTDDNFVCSR